MTPKTWGKIGKDIVKQLESKPSEYEQIGLAAVKEIYEREKTPFGRDNALKQISREILKKFPRKDSISRYYWFDEKGKSNLGKYRHKIFKYLTLKHSDGDVVAENVKKPLQVQPQKKVEPKLQAESEADFLTLDELIVDDYQLDAECLSLVQGAIALSGMTLGDFTRQALRVYAKTITGKTRRHSEDLTTVPTDDLINDPTYSTHPGRAEELTKRAIKAIKFYNANVAVENADRWCITQSAIATLIGSRPSTIGKVLEQFKDDIVSHNQTYNLDNYSNRKRGKPRLEEAIDLPKLVPDGLD